MKRTLNGVTRLFTYDEWKPIYEWNASGQYVAWNAYGPGADEIVFRGQAGAGYLRYHSDAHGNVTAVLDTSGNVLERYSYDAFGQPTITYADGSVSSNWSQGSAVGNRFLFQGREYLNEIGLYDYRHRFYDPALGRFLQTDPMGLQTEGEKLSAGQKALFSPGGSAPEAFSSSEMNLFRYCGDDPVDRSDPLGLLTLSEDFKKEYPESAKRILSMKDRVTSKKEEAWEKTSGANKDQINKALERDKGPEIKPADLFKAGDGFYEKGGNPKSEVLNIDKKTFQDFERKKNGAAEILDRSIEHELVHYFADHNNYRETGEGGYTYERMVYGSLPGE